MINISVWNQSTVYSDSGLQAMGSALGIQVVRDLFPIYGVTAKIWFTPKGSVPHADHWHLIIMDDAVQAGELGVHDVGPTNLPIMQVFARPVMADHSSVERTGSHELLEALVDPMANRCVQIGSRFYGEEIADSPEADSAGYEITIPDGWVGAGTKVPVSNFVTPNWFRPGSPGPYDHVGLIKRPLELLTGGYISFLDLNDLQAGWQQSIAREDNAARMRARPRGGSRRALRRIPIDQRIPSTYQTSDEAIPADSHREAA